MRIECLSISKYLNSDQPGDDVPFVLPDRCYAIFDGATDVNGSQIRGVGSGRFAALTAAASLASLFSRSAPGALSTDEIVTTINDDLATALARESELLGRRVGASTTMVLVEAVGETLRFTLVGDSGARVNGEEVFQGLKPVDDIMSAGRVALYFLLRDRNDGCDLEVKSRRGVFQGFDAAVPELISADESAYLLAQATDMLKGKLDNGLLQYVAPMLKAGIAKGQYRYANDPDHPLGYAVINGTKSRGPGLMSFERPTASVRSIELFSDGYLDLPEEVSLAAWEETAARIEREDPLKIGKYPGVKGSSATQHFDDRTVIVLRQ
ncbi:hypothetical protein V6767_06305 [Martelella sp. FLE1502]